MGGKSESGQTTTQSSSSQGWQPSMDIIKGLMPGLGQAATAGTTQSGDVTNALNSIRTNALQQPSYGAQATDLAGTLMAGGGVEQNANTVNSGYSDLMRRLNPYADGQYLDPTTAPGMQEVLATIRNDVGNSVNSMFAGAGRDMSGINQQQLARGIAQGEATPLLNQYNTNVGNQLNSAQNLYSASGMTAQQLQALAQQGYANQGQGLDYAMTGVPAAQNSQATNVLNADQLGSQYALGNYGAYTGLLGQLAGLGQTSSGTSNTTGFQQASPMQMAMGWSQAFRNLLPGSYTGGGK